MGCLRNIFRANKQQSNRDRCAGKRPTKLVYNFYCTARAHFTPPPPPFYPPFCLAIIFRQKPLPPKTLAVITVARQAAKQQIPSTTLPQTLAGSTHRPGIARAAAHAREDEEPDQPGNDPAVLFLDPLPSGRCPPRCYAAYRSAFHHNHLSGDDR